MILEMSLFRSGWSNQMDYCETNHTLTIRTILGSCLLYIEVFLNLEIVFWWTEWQRKFFFLVRLVWPACWPAIPDNVTSLQECVYTLLNPIELNYLHKHLMPDFVDDTSQPLKVTPVAAVFASLNQYIFPSHNSPTSIFFTHSTHFFLYWRLWTHLIWPSFLSHVSCNMVAWTCFDDRIGSLITKCYVWTR